MRTVVERDCYKHERDDHGGSDAGHARNNRRFVPHRQERVRRRAEIPWDVGRWRTRAVVAPRSGWKRKRRDHNPSEHDDARQCEKDDPPTHGITLAKRARWRVVGRNSV